MASFKDLGEFGFIDLIGDHLVPGWVLCGIGDDCAVLEGDGNRVRLVTTDTMVEGVHFLCAAPPEGLGHKLLAVNLSDVAAMGGVPTDAVISVAVPVEFDAGYVERLYQGLFACAERFDVAIVGGDTTRSLSGLVLSVTLTGHMDRSQVCYRSGAQSGDLLYVSGTLGDAAGGLGVMRGEVDVESEHRMHLLRQLHRPEPRVALGQALAASGAVTAMMDVSDGVASDVRHMCRRSGVSAVIQETAIPTSEAFRAFCEVGGHKVMDLALSGGEDYELLFAVDRDRVDAIEALSGQNNLPMLTCMGEMVEGAGDVFLERDGVRSELKIAGFDHFAR